MSRKSSSDEISDFERLGRGSKKPSFKERGKGRKPLKPRQQKW